MKTDHYHSNYKFTALLTTLIVLIGLCVSSVFLLFSINSEFTQATLPVFNNAQWQHISVQEDDTMDDIAAYFGIPAPTMQEILQLPTAAQNLTQLKAGAQLSFLFNQAHELTGLRYAIASGDELILTYHHSQWEAQVNHAPFYQRFLPTTMPTEKLQLTIHGLQTLQDMLISRGMLNAGISFLVKPVLSTHLPTMITDPQETHSFGVNHPRPRVLPQSSSLTSQKLFFASSAHLKTTSPIYRQLQNIFKGIVPLSSRLRRGERFSVIYDHAGRILLATVTLHRHTVEAIRFTDSTGHTGYYTPTGQALFKSLFLTAPVNYTRISDRFTLHRLHPILHITRPHYGIDYAAPTGTPIRAISSGRVSFTGWNGGYGNTVVINHGNRYQSLYAHIRHHSYTVKPGQWVMQGQIIGYVGSTGLATGPHLHFGLYEYGQAINPALVLPKSKPPTSVAQRDFQNFLAQTNRLLTQLALAQSHYIV